MGVDRVRTLPTTLVRLEPAFFPSLAVDVTLPSGWMRTHDRHQLACVLGLPTPIAVFERGPGLGALAAVSVSALPFEVGIADWCRFRFTQARWMLVSSRFIDTPHGRRFEILGARDTELGARRRRDISFLHGRWLVQIHLVGDDTSWSRSMLEWSIIGELAVIANGAPLGGCERRRGVAIPGTAIRLDVPITWTVAAARRGSVDIELVTDRAQQAWIHLRSRRWVGEPSALVLRAEGLLRELAGRGFALRHVAQPDRPGNDARLDELCFQGGCVADVLADGVWPRDCRMWHRTVDEYEIDAMLVAPPVGARHLPWMRAIRALELAFGTCRIDDVVAAAR